LLGQVSSRRRRSFPVRFDGGAKIAMADKVANNKNLPVVVGSIVAILGALAGILQWVVPWLSHEQDLNTQAEAAFNKSLADFETAATANAPNLTALRFKAEDAYRLAQGGAWWNREDWACSVVGDIYTAADPDLAAATPVDAYRDYDSHRLSKCADQVVNVARLDWDAYLRFKAPTDGAAAVRHELEIVVASGTNAQLQGWAYVGRTDAHGQYTTKLIAEPDADAQPGHTVSISPAVDDGLPLHATPQRASEDSPTGIVGFLPDGSTFKIVALSPVPELQKGAPSTYLVWAKAGVLTVSAMEAVAARRSHAREALARDVRGAPTQTVALNGADCPPRAQHNSVHQKDQLWVYIGQRPDTNASDAFVPGTARVKSACIPRDGQVVQATQDLKVLVGSDPVWPGVAPQGGVVAQGTDIRVVGDISGYPYDASKSSTFCNRDPAPQQHLVPIPAGDTKRYCVYLPFTAN
jgi:hypothetical protein